MLDSLRVRLWLGFAASILFSLIFSLLLGNSLLSPLRRMVKATKQIAQGKPEPLTPEGPLEVRQLAAAYE